MKIYRIASASVNQVKGRFNFIGESDGFVYVYGEGLNAPFEAANLPLELEERIRQNLNDKREEFIGVARGVVSEALRSFRSAALGSVHIYDFSIEEQINLMALHALGESVGISCTDSSGKKLRREHSVGQIKQLYGDAIRHKEELRRRYAEYKEDLAKKEKVEDLYGFELVQSVPVELIELAEAGNEVAPVSE